MQWYPLRLTTPIKQHIFGGRAIAQRWGRSGLPDGRVAETWEVSDVDGDEAAVVDGPLSGRPLRELVREAPAELVGRGWSGTRFPMLTKYIDAAGALPVHLHADDEDARRFEQQTNGKTEAWHILDAAPGATALVGVRPGIDREALRRALLDQDFDAVMRRLPLRAGQTLYVPGGTLHSFGPDTLIYEIEQTSDIQQHAMTWRMEDGSPLDETQRRANIDRLLVEWKPACRPVFHPGLSLPSNDDTQRTVLCAGPYFALERHQAGSAEQLAIDLDTAVILSNAGAAATLTAPHGWSGTLDRARTFLLPAALGRVEIDGPADVLIGYLPDLDRDIRAPLLAAGHRAAAIASLGEGLGNPHAAPGGA
ncbi:class I mannose-6-phosphate isomerase [Streptomyces zagrosensis]|uniref:Mannose-6-phosphate isomerase n=1 Tax=Streptomyces zagrosensis TaxID=1042984 RepID=A0A7W9QIV1_9ACTN|nr:class I mannose-6-phosphate isomerase [Streptomyces zagrosensis]MBB5939757.1 mannose-6-phosphate isomerase [Streptomyces zagrosensis]